MVLMFFYQFAGYNLIVYFSASILSRDEEQMAERIKDGKMAEEM